MSEKRLLIVDPDAFQRHLVQMLLAAEHFAITETQSAAEALKYLQESTPDLIVAEANLGDMPATDLCKRIKGIRRLFRVPVILIASPNEIKTIKELAPVVGADLVIEKPLGDKGLREQVNQLLAKTNNKSQLDIYKDFVPEPLTKPAPKKEEIQPKPKAVEKNTSSKPASIGAVPKAAETARPNFQINLLPNSFTEKSKLKPVNPQDLKLEPKSTTFETVAIQKPKTHPPLNSEKTTGTPEKLNQTSSIPDSEESLIRPVAENPGPKRQNKNNIRETPANPADLLPPIKPKAAKANNNQMTELALLRKQVEQLIEENEQLKDAIKEFKSGVPIVSSQSYLNAVEELEALRRLTEQQAKQLESYLGKRPDDPKLADNEKKAKKPETEKTVWNRIVKGI